MSGPAYGLRPAPRSSAGRSRCVSSLAEARERNAYSLRARFALEPEESGVHRLSMVTTGWARVFLDGELVIDAWRSGVPRGSDLFGMGSVPLEAQVTLESGRTAEIVVEGSSQDAPLFGGFQLGCHPPAAPRCSAYPPPEGSVTDRWTRRDTRDT